MDKNEIANQSEENAKDGTEVTYNPTIINM